MTKKDYKTVARAIWNCPLDYGTRNLIVLHLCRELKGENPSFNPPLFIKACGAEHSVLLALQ